MLFGTGKYLEGSDVSGNLEVMSYYSVLDAKAGEKLRANLTPRELLTYNGLRSISGNVVDWNTSSGWYFDLVERTTLGGSVSALGERVVSGSKVRRKVLFFNTNIPSGSACSSGGTGWLMSLSLDTGLAPKHGVFDANKDEDIDESSAPVTTDNDSNNDGVVDDGDVGYIGEISEDGLVSDPNLLGDKRYTQESTGEVIEDDVNTGEGQQEGRLSWEEQIQQ